MNELLIYLSQYSTALEIFVYCGLLSPAVIVAGIAIKEISNGQG